MTLAQIIKDSWNKGLSPVNVVEIAKRHGKTVSAGDVTRRYSALTNAHKD